MKKKLFSLISLAVVGSLAFGSAAFAESINGSGATFPQSFQSSATAAFNAATGHTATYANRAADHRRANLTSRRT